MRRAVLWRWRSAVLLLLSYPSGLVERLQQLEHCEWAEGFAEKDLAQTHEGAYGPSDLPREPMMKSQVHVKDGVNVCTCVVDLYGSEHSHLSLRPCVAL